MLDYILLGSELKGNVRSVQVASDAAAKTSHSALRLELAMNAQEGGSKTRPKKYERWRWPGWREASAGQFQYLLRPSSWSDMSSAEKDISRAGRASAAFSAKGRQTPFDAMASSLIDQRRGIRCPMKRRFIQRALLEVRRHQKQWRATQRVKAATAHGRNLATSERSQHIVVLSGTSTVALRKADFQEHREVIMVGDPREDTQGCKDAEGQTPARKEIAPPQRHEGKVPIDLEVLVGVLRKLRLGRTGGADGVAAEFPGGHGRRPQDHASNSSLQSA